MSRSRIRPWLVLSVLLAVAAGVSAQNSDAKGGRLTTTPEPLNTPIIEYTSGSSGSSSANSEDSSSSAHMVSSSSKSTATTVHPFSKQFVEAEIAKAKQHSQTMKASPDLQKLAAAISVDSKASVVYASKDSLCHQQGGLCKTTAECFQVGGRTIDEAKPLCGGPVARQCCFPTLVSANTHHNGPLDTLNEHQTLDKTGKRPTSPTSHHRAKLYSASGDEDLCSKHKGSCMETSKCYRDGGRTVKEASAMCDGTKTKQCCFFSEKRAKGKHHMAGPLDTLKELSQFKFRQMLRRLDPDNDA